ncbi:MAG: lipopolysaccharide biosynthesis protein [Candidatus Latescibacteria bacterium]|nr:lipopolysaccharide biosynthesis protein [Candidatus Latescibacterota bacterium]
MAGPRLARQVGLVAAGRAGLALSTFAGSAILAWTWTPAEMGSYLAVWRLVNTLIPFFLLGFPTSFLYFFPRLKAPGQQTLVLQASGCLAAAGLLLAMLVRWGGPYLNFLLDSETQPLAQELEVYLGAFLPYTCFWVAGGLVEPGLVAAGRPQWQALMSLGMAVGQLGLVLSAWGGDWSVAQVLWGFSVLGGVRLGAGAWLVAKAVGWTGARWSSSGLGEYLRYSLPVALGDVVGSLSRAVDRLVVLWFFSNETFAFYDLGAVEVPVSVLLASATTVLIPQVSGLYAAGRTEAIAELWSEAIRRLSLVVLPLFSLLFFQAGPFIAVLLPEQYGHSAWVMRIFLLALPLRCAIYNPLLVGMGKARWAWWVGVGDLVFNLGLSLLLTQLLLTGWPAWAFLGPALAAVFSTYVQVVFLVGLIAWHLRWGVSQLLPWGHLGRVALVSALAGGVSWGLVQLVDPPLARLVLGAGIFAGVLLLGAQPQDREIFRKLFKSR